MPYDKKLIAAKLRRWEKYLNEYRLPSWNMIPDIGLYMEQVTALLRDYLDYMPPEIKEEQIITPAAINNYVRKKIMPEPVRKKYYRAHIAYLIIICSLKQCLSIPVLRKMIPVDMSPEELRRVYDSYAQRHALASRQFVQQGRAVAAGILDHEEKTDFSTDSTEELITFSAVYSGFARLLAEKLLLLEGMDEQAAAEAEKDRRER